MIVFGIYGIRRPINKRVDASCSHGFSAVMPKVLSSTELAGCIKGIAEFQDRAAFIILFEHYAPRLKRYFSRLGVLPGTADDLVQETMLRVWNKAGHFNPDIGSASAWVFTIARNLRVTARGKRRFVSIEDDISEIEELASGPERLLAVTEIESHLRQALDMLPEAQADLLKASFFEGKTHIEIARERDMPLGTVKSKLRRSLARLRHVMLEAL